jgi:pimeloyl-ACP methyl ester carboxylesterase
LKPVPVVVLCQPEPWLRVPSNYQPAVLALAEMGVFVVQINARSTWGSGRHQREIGKDGFEVGQVDDIVSTLDWLSQRFTMSLKRVAIMGERRGAYLALRALQLRPDRFRCAFALEPTIDLGGWLAEARWNGAAAGPVLTRGFYGSKEQLTAAPLVKQPESIKGAVLLMSYRGPLGTPVTFAHRDALQLEKALHRQGTPVHLSELSEDYMQRLPGAKAAVFREIEDFLNENIYAFRVDLGDVKEKSE